MKEIFSIILIGIALSMDTFSLSLGVGMFNVSRKKALILSSIVGVMHFLQPMLGMMLGEQLIKTFELKCDILLGIILIFIAMQMIIDIIKHEEEAFNLSFLGMLLFAFGVSIDSFSVGLGIKAFLFTYGGIIVGKQANKILGMYANIIGVIILFILGLAHLL